MPSVRPSAPRARVIIVSPALARANNGNWQTASRWARFLRKDYHVATVAPDVSQDALRCDVLIALHARRSARVVRDFAAAHPGRPLIVVLTGTDLYRDLPEDADAQRSLELATQLVVLQEQGLAALPRRYRGKTRVIYQSARYLAAGRPRSSTFDVAFVGHLREEKDPLTAMRAVDLLPEESPLRILHVGNALDPSLGREAAALARREARRARPRYAWLGGLAHGRTRQLIKRSRLLLVSSIMEGGANVIVEAVASDVPVVASRVSGNVGMLGRAYPGYFPCGDARALARVLTRAAESESFYASLASGVAARKPLFAPDREARAVLALVRQTA